MMSGPEICNDDDETVTKDIGKNPLQTIQESDIAKSSDDSSCVQVAVRVRPLLPLEAGSGRCLQVLEGSSKPYSTTIQLGGSSGPRFTFDQAFDVHASQKEIFDQRVQRLVDSCLEGYNATVLAYGQTGSGKTYTMMGTEDSVGMIPRAFYALFQNLPAHTVVQLQFLEVYGDEIRDLLAHEDTTHQKLTIRDLGNEEPEVVGATLTTVTSAKDALRSLSYGMMRRVTGATAMNCSSSRSHAILSVFLQQKDHDWVKRSKFHFVDLAGSERLKRTMAEGQRMKEGIDINKGLLVLGNVISALGDPKRRGNTFVPYRDSKLTRLLKGSLGGNHKTLMIACVSPSENNMEESLSCLRYANRAKNIQNNAIVNVDETSRRIAELQDRVRSLASTLLNAIDGGSILVPQGPWNRPELESMAGGKPTLSSSALIGSLNKTTSNSQLEMEVYRLRDQLRQIQAHHEEVEEQLYVYRAQNEIFKLQLNGVEIDTRIQDKLASYEAEIARLKLQLKEAQHKQALRLEDVSNIRHQFESNGKQWENNSLSYHRSWSEVDGDETMDETVQKFLKQSASSDDDDDDEEMHSLPEDDQSCSDGLCTNDEKRNQDIQAHLFELQRSISAKEELIDQLRFSEEKLANMREFYEDKIQQMVSALDDKEEERAMLIRELEHVKMAESTRQELRERLQEKEQHINDLRKKHKQLVDLTSVSSRNQEKINKLESDITEMKKKKVELQKLVHTERRNHITEVKVLQKSVAQKDRELNKVKKLSAHQKTEAARANQIAKTRLNELGQLRTKYKEAEKRIRMLSVKRGVMAKVGIDPIVVGRRVKSNLPRADRGDPESFDVDSLRDFFDEKVAEVVKKEALADKVAQEWEEHFELSSRRDALASNAEERDDDECRTLNIQIHFKEERIRKLASRLGTQMDNGNAVQNDRWSLQGFLDDEKFSKLFTDRDPQASTNLIAKVLFGMIVREKRRTAALARTASSLDERLRAAQKDACVSESAFRAYMEEQNEEVAALAQNQQEHILSLMDLVKEESMSSTHNNPCDKNTNLNQTMMLVLANERIAAMEKQIDELKARADNYRVKTEEMNHIMQRKSGECEEALDAFAMDREMLQKLRLNLQNFDTSGNALTLVEVLKGILFPGDSDDVSDRRLTENKACASPADRIILSRLSRSAEFLDDLSDEDVIEAAPAWAADIMADLAIIAEGKMPPSLEDTISAINEDIKSELRIPSVFDRLADPQSFTGTQKQVVSASANRARKFCNKPSIGHTRKTIAREIDDSLDKCVALKDDADKPSSTSEHIEQDSLKHRTVFDRLGSPSYYTGTQRDKFVATRAQRSHHADEAANRLLDDLLKEGGELEHSDLHESLVYNSHSVYSDYTQLDVFERLQKTTTQAFAVKHGITSDIVSPVTVPNLSSGTRVAPNDPKRSSAREEVFERLTKTTTEAFAKKVNKGKS